MAIGPDRVRPEIAKFPHMQVFAAATLLFVLLNPFLMSVYLGELVHSMTVAVFARIVIRAGLIAALVFIVFAIFGDAVFRALHVQFPAFLIFGGIVFFVLGLRFVLRGGLELEALRGPPEYLSGAVAMPFMIGPGTVSAAVLIGGRLDGTSAAAAVGVAMAATVVSLVVLKAVHDWVKQRNAAIVDRYMEVVGRISALYIGTYSVQMVLQGIAMFVEQHPSFTQP
jgi:multiple antibiotic resistance protein